MLTNFAKRTLRARVLVGVEIDATDFPSEIAGVREVLYHVRAWRSPWYVAPCLSGAGTLTILGGRDQ